MTSISAGVDSVFLVKMQMDYLMSGHRSLVGRFGTRRGWEMRLHKIVEPYMSTGYGLYPGDRIPFGWIQALK